MVLPKYQLDIDSAKNDRVMCVWSGGEQCDQIGLFLKCFVTDFPTKVAQNMCDFRAILKIVII